MGVIFSVLRERLKLMGAFFTKEEWDKLGYNRTTLRRFTSKSSHPLDRIKSLILSSMMKKVEFTFLHPLGSFKIMISPGLEVISEEPIFSTKIALSKFKEMWLSNWPTETTNNVSLTPHLQLLSSIRFNPVSKTFDAVDGLVLDDETSDQVRFPLVPF